MAITPDYKYLGTIAGEQTLIDGAYARLYVPFISTDCLRSRITEVFGTQFGEGCKRLGEDYSFTPVHIPTAREFGERPGSLQGGGFFLTVKELNGEQKYFTSAEYALSQFGPALEKIAHIPLKEILAQCSAYGIDYIVRRYFEAVDHPEEGNLVLYHSSEPINISGQIIPADKINHVGIYRNSEPNWNSPPGGSVESKWGSFAEPYVFQHDFFFTPHIYGDTAVFYQLRKEAIFEVAIPDNLDPMGTFNDDKHFFFTDNHTNRACRKFIDQTLDPSKLVENLPQIAWLKDINFNSKCHDYALGKFLKTYSMPDNKTFEGTINHVLQTYFTITTQPQKGDLVTYYQNKSHVHTGIYYAENCIESKWGKGPVFRHAPFAVPSEYGDTIIFHRLRDGLTPETLLQQLRK